NNYSDNFLLFNYIDTCYTTRKGKLKLPPEQVPYILKFSEPSEKGIIIAHLGGICLAGADGNISKYTPIPLRVQDACYFKNDIYIASNQGLYRYTPSGNLMDLKRANRLFRYRVDDIDLNTARNEL